MSCGVCGSAAAAEIEVLRSYSRGPMHVCKACGTVYVRDRRPSDDIAKEWSDSLFGGHYIGASPYIKARHVFVAESIHQRIRPLTGLRVCDVGAGEGYFLELVRTYGADVFGIEPSSANVARMQQLGIDAFCGTAESYTRSGDFDVVTILWTLEACSDIAEVLKAARRLVKPDGIVVVATGSRILVPFKKPLHFYIDKMTDPDTHPYRLSIKTTRVLFARCGLNISWTNSYFDSDTLLVAGQPCEPHAEKGDDWKEVIAFFERWDRDSQYYRDHGYDYSGGTSRPLPVPGKSQGTLT